MVVSAQFEYLKAPVTFCVEDIEAAHLEAFVITGIVNPVGPTLTFLATEGRSKKRRIIYAMLNPFRCEVKQIGTFTEGDAWLPDQEFATLAEYLSGSCPTLILTSQGLDAETRSRVTDNLFAHFDDAEGAFEHVRHFFGNPFDRVSHSMGINVPNPGSLPVELQDAAWNEIVSDPRHVWPELTAFMVAWDGSINRTGISDEMKYGAFPTERMKSILLPMLESVWTPEAEHREPAAPAEPPERPLTEPKNLEEIREKLVDRSWENLRGDNLLQFMEWSLLLYGREEDEGLIPSLRAMYEHVRKHVDSEHRQLHLQRISLGAAKHNLAACTLLPPLLCDDDPFVASTAMLDYIALSHPNAEGLPSEFSALESFFRSGAFECPGAALGGLITCGDRRFHSKLHEWKRHLAKEDIRTARHCQTPFITHGEIIFWLDWADELVGRTQSAELLAFAASALSALGRNNPYNSIQDVERRYPAYSVKQNVVVVEEWDRSEYAGEIADRLYCLEAGDEPPRDCRRLPLLRRRSHYEQDNEQVFTRGSHSCGADDIGPPGRLSIALVSGRFHCGEDRLRAADASRVGEEG